MSLLRQIAHGFRNLTLTRNAQQDISDEVSHYVQESTAEFERKGLSPEDARRAALRELGSMTSTREQIRSYGWENAVQSLLADFRYACRRLAANPGFTTVSILTLTLGIGATTAIFSVVNAVLLRALSYPRPQQLVRVWEQSPRGNRMNLSGLNFLDFRSQNAAFSELAVYGLSDSSVITTAGPVRLEIAEVSTAFFQTLAVEPFLGRTFSADEQRPHAAPAAVVTYDFWRLYLNSTPDLASAHITVDGAPCPVIGVMPQSVDFPAGVSAWVPRERQPELTSRTAHNWRALGRLREGVTVSQARANLETIARRLKSQYGNDVDLYSAAVAPLAEDLTGSVRTALLTLFVAVSLLLLIACTNVASLLLARASARQRELAISAALGAGRARLLQQFFAESFLLSFAGGALGLLLATFALRLLPALPLKLPRQDSISIDVPVLIFAAAVIFAVAFVLGLFAALRSQAKLSGLARSHSAGHSAQRLRAALVVGEIATTLVILISAGLLARSFLTLSAVNPGFSPRNLYAIQLSFPPESWESVFQHAGASRRARMLTEILTRLRALPGVSSAGVISALPVGSSDSLSDGDFLILNGRQPPRDFDDFARMSRDRVQVGHADYCAADAAYFRTLLVPLRRGRLFNEQDSPNTPHVALISEALARQRWPDQDPIGQTVDFGNMDGDLRPVTIVGIVGDIRASGLDAPPSPILYVNSFQRGLDVSSSPSIVLRASQAPDQIFSAARQILRDAAPEMPVRYSTFNEEMRGWFAQRRLLLLLVASFAAAALALAAIGIYGLIAFSVSRRTAEIGIRMALGGRRRHVLGLIVGEGARLAGIGIILGVAVSLAVTRLLSSLLFGVTSTDPVTFLAVALLLSLVALLAAFLPARRALRLDASTALRQD